MKNRGELSEGEPSSNNPEGNPNKVQRNAGSLGVKLLASGSFLKQDVWTVTLLFFSLLALYTLTRSRWLDDWDSIGFALALDNFDLGKHQPHPPGFPIYVAAGKLIHLLIRDHAAALTLVSAVSGAAVASMFYTLLRRHLVWSVALFGAVTVALSPLFWLQAELALTDMFGMVFLLSFMLVEGASTRTRYGDTLRLAVSGVIAGLSLGARPHVTLLIIAYWAIDALFSRTIKGMHFLTAAVSFAVGVAAWLIPTSWATGGLQEYLSACLSQFVWRLDKPAVSVLGGPLNGEYLLWRGAELLGSLGQTFAPLDITTHRAVSRAALGLAVLLPYIYFAWQGKSKGVARPYIAASAVYLVVLYIVLIVEHQRYFLPFSFILGWSLPGFLALFSSRVRIMAIAAFLALNISPSFRLIGALAQAPPVAAMEWVRSFRPLAILYTDPLRRHAGYYWPEGDRRLEPVTQAECEKFRTDLLSNRPVLSTTSELCGVIGKKVLSFLRDPRVHDKHHSVTLFEFHTVPSVVQGR